MIEDITGKCKYFVCKKQGEKGRKQGKFVEGLRSYTQKIQIQGIV